MSYILTALKKAEQSRDGHHPDAGASGVVLSDNLARFAPSAPQGRSLRPWLGIVVVMGVMIAVVLFVLNKGEAVPSSDLLSPQTLSPENQPPKTESEQPAPAAQGAEPAALAGVDQVTEPQGVTEAQMAAKVPASVNNRESSSRNVFRITDPGSGINSNTAAPMPTLNITGYIFFENNPAASKVFVEGIVYRLGSTLGDNMIIREFKPDRVIVSWRGAAHDVLIP